MTLPERGNRHYQRPAARATIETSAERIDITKTAEAPFALVDRIDIVPLCPHCDQQLNEVYRKGTGFPLGQGRTLIYFCPSCTKVLGFAQGRVF